MYVVLLVRHVHIVKKTKLKVAGGKTIASIKIEIISLKSGTDPKYSTFFRDTYSWFPGF